MPAQKKDPGLRRRRNKTASADTLSSEKRPPAPDLPDHPSGGEWHPQAVEFWFDAWASPMSVKWHTATDRHNVVMCAMLIHEQWTADSSTARIKAMTELRLQRADLMLAPRPRFSAELTFEEADEATEKGNTRRAAKKAATKRPAKKAPADPRAHLHSVPDTA